MAAPIDPDEVLDEPVEDLDPARIRADYPGLSVLIRRRKFGQAADRHRAIADRLEANGRPLLAALHRRMANACDAKLAALGG